MFYVQSFALTLVLPSYHKEFSARTTPRPRPERPQIETEGR